MTTKLLNGRSVDRFLPPHTHRITEHQEKTSITCCPFVSGKHPSMTGSRQDNFSTLRHWLTYSIEKDIFYGGGGGGGLVSCSRENGCDFQASPSNPPPDSPPFLALIRGNQKSERPFSKIGWHYQDLISHGHSS